VLRIPALTGHHPSLYVAAGTVLIGSGVGAGCTLRIGLAAEPVITVKFFGMMSYVADPTIPAQAEACRAVS
jgi:hypothetical protein